MSPLERPPLIGVPACLISFDGLEFHRVGNKYVTAVLDGADSLPVLIPALGQRLDIDALLDRLDGLLITGSPSNVEAHHYGAEQIPDSLADPARDATTLPLIRRAVACAVPLLAICRGIQELNVALGGTLHQEVHALTGRIDHRSDKSLPRHQRFDEAHVVTLTSGGMLQELLGGPRTITVNSLHGQAIDRVAPDLHVEALADDGTIEAVRVVSAPAFAIGVQWHPEWHVRENPLSHRLFAAFGAACRERCASRASSSSHRHQLANTC